MAASMSVAAMRNRYLTAYGNKEDAIEVLAYTSHHLGSNDICAQVLLRILREKDRRKKLSDATWSLSLLGRSLSDMGHYGIAVKYFRIVLREAAPGDKARTNSLLWWIGAAGTLGRSKELREILRDHREELKEARIDVLMEGYRNALTGKPVDLEALAEKRGKLGWESSRQILIFLAQMDLVRGTSAYRKDVREVVQLRPYDRAFWILLDLYNRRDPQPDLADFYDVLGWLHGGDPWVTQAVRDFHRRARPRAPQEEEALFEKLQDYEPARFPEPNSSRYRKADKLLRALPPRAIAAAVRRLLQRLQFTQAEELALRYRTLSVDASCWGAKVDSMHLLHLVEQAKTESNSRKARKLSERGLP